MKRIIESIRTFLINTIRIGPFRNFLKFIYWGLPNKWIPPTYVRDALRNISKKRKVKFIQIGANDGVRGDPIHEYVIKYHWNGILVEPNTFFFEKLRENYNNDTSHLVFLNSAIGESGKFTLYWAPLSQGTGSLDKNHVLKCIGRENAASIQEIDVACITFSELIDQNPDFRSVDLLIIDAEGHDATIVCSIDFEKFKADVIIFEFMHLTNSEIEKSEKYLQDHGYFVKYDESECIAVNRTIQRDVEVKF